MINQLYEKLYINLYFEIWVNKENIKLANKRRIFFYFKAAIKKMGS